MENFKNFYEDLTYTENFYDCIKDSECVVIMTDWDEFKQPNWNRVGNMVKEKNIVDTRNIYNPKEIKKA
jgi:UDPglucose 6-dehydrogenase